jgi:hypothetical protein
MLPLAGGLVFLWILLHALFATASEARQWPRRLGRFLFAILAGSLIFAVIYAAGGLIVSTLGYTYQDKPLLRLAHLVCLLGAYPAGMAPAAIFRTRHVVLIQAILLVLAVHLWDHGTYLGRMVFSDPSIFINGDFSLTNMALMLVSTLMGGEVVLRRTLKQAFRRAQAGAVEIDTA